jgi:transcriptional pleiotropic regulator of transition state genes
MKATGIVRKVDELGRIVIPKELRTVLEIAIKDPIEIFMEDDLIILKKYNPSCCFCSSMDKLRYFKGKNVCKACVEGIQNSSK